MLLRAYGPMAKRLAAMAESMAMAVIVMASSPETPTRGLVAA